MSSDVTYRLAHEDDLSAMRLIQSTALYDLVVSSSGRKPSAVITEERSTEMRHLLQTDPRLAWIAVEDGRPIGFSVGFVRNKLWFVADLFVLPEAHSKGVGGELLKRSLAAGAERGESVLAVASSHDQSAQALYIKVGMIPRFPLFGIEGAAERLRGLPSPISSANETIRKGRLSKGWIRRLGDLDEITWGRWRRRASLLARRVQILMLRDHRWLRRASRLRILFESCQPPPLNRESYRIGPVAARSARQQLSLLRDRPSDECSGRRDYRVPSSENQYDCPERIARSGIQDRSRRTIYGVANIRAL